MAWMALMFHIAVEDATTVTRFCEMNQFSDLFREVY